MVSHADWINQLRFDYENFLFHDLNRYQEIQAWQSSSSAQHFFNLHKRHLLGTAVRITDSLFPQLSAIYRDCLARIDTDLNGYLYIHQASVYNASVYAHQNHFDILLTSALVKDFKPTEIAFVIGHELGHVLFDHHIIPATQLLFDEQAPQIPAELAWLLLQWSRAKEISADRIGFLTCGDLSSAANAFFKLASGIQLDDDNRVIQALRMQFDEIKAMTSQFSNPNQWEINTHPLIPIRFKSLELISLDLLALRNVRRQLRISDLVAINREVQQVLVQTEPARFN